MTDVTPLKTPRNKTQLCDIYPLGRGERHFLIRPSVWHEIFAGFNFCDICDFSCHPQKISSRKQKLPQTFFFRRNLLQSEYSLTLKIRYTKIQSLEIVSVLSTICLFRSETKRLTTKYWFTQGTQIVVLFENMYFYCTYSIKVKMFSRQVGLP